MTPSRASGRLLIAETQCSGHHLVYVRLLVEGALAHGDEVVLATTEDVTQDQRFSMHIGSLQDRIEVVLVEKGVSITRLQAIGSGLGADTVLVPDALPFRFGLLLGKRMNAPTLRLLIMNDPRWSIEGSRTPQVAQRVKLLFLLLVSLRRGQALYWLRPPGFSSERERYVCDPVVIDRTVDEVRIESAQMRTQMGMSSDVYWFGVVGGIAGWKNPALVARAVIAASRMVDARLGLAFIGPWRERHQLDEVVAALREGDVAVAVHDQHLSNEQMNVAVSALDCVVVAYSTFAPNSTTGKAASLGVRVIAAGPPSFRRFAKEVAGVQGVTLDLESLEQAMIASVVQTAPSPRLGFGTVEFTEPLLRRDLP